MADGNAGKGLEIGTEVQGIGMAVRGVGMDGLDLGDGENLGIDIAGSLLF